ncbi:MAG: rhodanese-like domain-containing protein [Oligoflexia bacterium]|nr:rhodanese-like domain-containing protein [Oligoflexia bacterium]
MHQVIIDVREKDEFDSEHIENSIHVPLSNFERQAPALFKTFSGKSVLLICRSGKRANIAASQAASFCEGVTLEVFNGGITEWARQGKPTITSQKICLPIMRQVQLVAGSLVLTGVVLAYFVNPSFIFLSGFVGAGLIFAGVTGFCGMAELLARMPWNRSQ